MDEATQGQFAGLDDFRESMSSRPVAVRIGAAASVLEWMVLPKLGLGSVTVPGRPWRRSWHGEEEVVNNNSDRWRGLQPEMERFMQPHGRKKTRITMEVVVRFRGGYRGPVWRIDRRSQPLRNRRTVERLRTLLRRDAVTRVKIGGKSFRQIGKELGISQVAAWKLWHQVLRDVIEIGCAERAGWARLAEAQRKEEAGNPEPLLLLLNEATLTFGVRAMSAMLREQPILNANAKR